MRTYPARFVGELTLAEYDERMAIVGDFAVVNVQVEASHPTRYFGLRCPCGRSHLLPLNGNGATWGLVSANPPTIAGSILSHCTDGVCDHAGAVHNGTHCHVVISNGEIQVLDDTTAPLLDGGSR